MLIPESGSSEMDSLLKRKEPKTKRKEGEFESSDLSEDNVFEAED